MGRELTLVDPDVERTASAKRTDTAILLAIAGVVALVHVLTNNRYGLHRDELQTLSDALHMEWGFVAYPPLTPFVERVSMVVFGHWLIEIGRASCRERVCYAV